VTETLVSTGLQTVFCGLMLCVSSSVMAEAGEEASPEMEFLEYLGMWEESDEDWQLLDKDSLAEIDKRNDPVPDGEESTEIEDES
jgi:hypothetical protein